jgi:hypothetical protein
MSLVSSAERSPDVRGIVSTFQASAAMTRLEGQELEAAFASYQEQTQELIASMYAENLKLQLALNEALRREESAALISTKTVETLQTRIASLESSLDATRQQMITEAQKAKEQMAEMTKNHAAAMQTALTACRSQASANQAAAVAAVQTRAQGRLNEAAQAVSRLDAELQVDINWYTNNAGKPACNEWPGKRQAEYTKAKLPPILSKLQAPF